MTKIALYGSCWPTNIGNAFVSHGVLNQLKLALGDTLDITHIGGLSPYIFFTQRASANNLDIAKYTHYDYVVMAGMTQCDEHWRANENTIRTFVEKGAKIILLGAGAGTYNAKEVKQVRRFMKTYPIHLFISRDRYSYEQFHDLSTHALDGIDSAFFVNETFKGIQFNCGPFAVANFDTLNVRLTTDDKRVMHPSTPDLSGRAKSLLRYMHSALLFRKKEINSLIDVHMPLEGRHLFLTHHTPWPDLYRSAYFKNENTLMSDLPSDYLSLYQQADYVYTDRIHACIATLAFGVKARLFGRHVPRLRMFERVALPHILTEISQLDQARHQQDKATQIAFLQKHLGT